MICLCLLLHLFYNFSRNCRFREQNWQLSNIVNDFGNSNFVTAVHFHFHGCHYFGEGQHYSTLLRHLDTYDVKPPQDHNKHGENFEKT